MSEGIIGRIVVSIAKRLLPKDYKGSLTITLPSGRVLRLGELGTGIDADLGFKNFSVIRAGLRRAHLGFFESYMAGDIESSNPTNFFRFYLQNRDKLDGAGKGIFFASWLDKFWHWRHDNTKEGSRDNIAAHYDLGNAFYKLWLDDTMTYSSAIFSGSGNSLEAAQRKKYGAVMDAMEMQSGDQVLEIGSGWGGFAEEAGKAGAHVRGITLSTEQLAFATARMDRENLSSRCRFHLEDYRDTKGLFDRIASIEMIEAVGEVHWPAYFKVLHDRLKPGGVAAIQGITIIESNYDSYRNGVDFIQRYVFPGGMLLTKKIMTEQAEKAGLLLEKVECFGQSYATTLRLWAERFEKAWPQIVPLGFDEKFRRTWRLYLSYCEAGFTEELIDVGIYKLRKPA
jgi:cyclopropane-fatty-acyl-phospholipid synthase